MTTTAPPPAAVRAATHATAAAFIGSGFAFASWAARIPQLRDRLDLDPAALGLVLLAVAAGSLLALPLSGPVVTRHGSARTVAVTAVLLAVGVGVVAAGSVTGVVPVVAGLFLVGLANGAWDVAMNVQGTVVERRLGRSVMSRLHAGFSLGTVAGALLGAAAVAAGVPVAAHLGAVALAVLLVVPCYTRRFLADREPAAGAGDARSGPGDAPAGAAAPGAALAAWREPRTLLTGVFVLAFAFTEGVGNDWISVAAIDGHHVPPALGTLAFAAFLAAMTVGRWFGPKLLDRHGRVPVVRALALVGIAGVALFVVAPSPPAAFAGTLLWGLGASLGFPVGMSAGGDDPRRAAARVSVIASIGYCAFLAGPPVVGFLGRQVTVLRALLVVAALLGLAALIAGTVREPATPATPDDPGPGPARPGHTRPQRPAAADARTGPARPGRAAER